MASVPLNLANHPTRVVLDLGCTGSLGSRAAIRRFQKDALYYGITTEFCRCNKCFVCANSETETCWESCIIHFPTTPPCSTGVDVLETGNVPILFSLSQMKNLGLTWLLNWIRRETHITCLAFGLYSFSSWILYNGTYCFGLDESSGSPPSKRHATFIDRWRVSFSNSYTRTWWIWWW